MTPLLAASWWYAGPHLLLTTALAAVGIYLTVILYTRLCGVRSFAKMSGFDFAMTIAVGSVLGSTALSADVPLAVGVTVLSMLFAMQWLIAKGRQKWPTLSTAVDNEPILVVREGRVLPDNLRRAALTRSDLIAKLREANVLRLDHVRAVVVETTGDVTVLHGPPDVEVAPELFDDLHGLPDPDTPTEPISL